MQLGNYTVTTYNFGNFRLDGGAMFGSVPKNLWNKRLPADSENCIPLATRSLLIRDKQRVILVDTGLGNKWTERSKEIFAVEYAPLPSAAEVTDVILTHLHFDHAGGVSQQTPAGALELAYPQARHWLQKANLEHAKKPNQKDKASYLKENITPLSNAQLHLLDGASEIFPQISVHPIHGHTPGQQYIKITSETDTLIFPSDLVPTAHHLPVPFHMGYDLQALILLEEKNQLLEEACQNNWIVVFQHDCAVPAARIGKDERGVFCVRELVTL